MLGSQYPLQSGSRTRWYRRATAIASASLPPDHPMVVDSRQNLEDFCRARALPIDAAVIEKPPSPDTEPGRDAFAPEDASGVPETPIRVRASDAGFKTPAMPRSSGRPLRDPRRATSTSFQLMQPAPHGASRLAWLAIGVVALVAVAFVVRRPWSPRETSTPAPMAAPTAPQAADPALALPAMPSPIEQAQPPKVASRGDDRDVVAGRPTPSTPSSDAISLATVQLCQTFSTSGGRWRCDPACDSVAKGPLVLYTRVRSPRDAAVVHRWYRGDTLQQSVKLPIHANATEGYRTYSRQTVDGVGDWRVEVSSVNGELLHEQRFAVR